jgi:hypothetical protein
MSKAIGVSRDFEDFNFLHLETQRTREKRFPVQSGVVSVTAAKRLSEIVGVCVAAIVNSNVITKLWTESGITQDCLVHLFGLQRKSPRREVVWIPQREKKTLQTRVGLEAVREIPKAGWHP